MIKNGSHRYKYVVVKYNTAYFIKDEIDSPNKYSETDIIRMVEFCFINNIYTHAHDATFQYAKCAWTTVDTRVTERL